MKKIGIIVALTIFSFSSSMAQLIKVDQEVFGMDCAPCAYGLERGLKKMDGLESVKVSLNDGKAYLTLATDNELTLQKIQKEVKNNGFSAKSAEVILQGELQQKGNHWQVNVNNETFQIDSDTEGRITTAMKPGTVKLKGLVHDEEEDNLENLWKIEVTEIY
jgi:cation transport ATPase